MRKHKVFMATGTIQTVIASYWKIDWNDGVLRFFTSEDITIAVFPPGGWHGMQDVSVYEDSRKVAV